jgi:hypothetical protein
MEKAILEKATILNGHEKDILSFAVNSQTF